MNQTLEFDWDESNRQKIWRKHGVDTSTSEAIFDDAKRVIGVSTHQPDDETRYYCLGQVADRLYKAIFVIRDGRIRIISAHRSDPKKGSKLGYQYS